VKEIVSEKENIVEKLERKKPSVRKILMKEKDTMKPKVRNIKSKNEKEMDLC
jgi:hypothetical protein